MLSRVGWQFFFLFDGGGCYGVVTGDQTQDFWISSECVFGLEGWADFVWAVFEEGLRRRTVVQAVDQGMAKEKVGGIDVL